MSNRNYMLVAAAAGVASVAITGCKNSEDDVDKGTLAYTEKIAMFENKS